LIGAYEPLSRDAGVVREMEAIATGYAKSNGLDRLPERTAS
jgi:hypothetical protein